jgi:hypothetical protein
MNKQLSDLFNLPEDDEPEKNDDISHQPLSEDLISEETLETIDKIESALPAVKGLEASDKEMDDLAADAHEAFKSLLDLGFQVDSRFASEIFNSAGSMLGHAITAKVAKTNKKLKTIQLQLQKADLDRKILAQQAKGEAPGAEIPLGQGQVLDRNEIIKQILEQSKSQSKDK